MEKTKVFENHGFNFGRMVSGSKSWYMERFPEHKVVFNARVYDLKTFKKHKDGDIKDFFKGMSWEIWYGDLDITVDMERLQEVANQIGTFVITNEHGTPIATVVSDKFGLCATLACYWGRKHWKTNV